MPIRRTTPIGTKRVPSAGESDRLTRELREIQEQSARLTRKHEASLTRLANLPRELEEKKKKQVEAYRLEVMTSVAGDSSIRRPRKKTPPPQSLREQRKAMFQFIILCLVLLIVLALMVRAVILFSKG